MDDIQLVDCFERLHQHLLRHEPELEKRLEAETAPYAYRTGDPSFFLTQIVAVFSGIDERTAEGKRRIRRFLLELDAERPADSSGKHLMIREEGGVFDKPLSPAQKEAFFASLRNLEDLSSDEDGRFGAAFGRELEALEHLPDRVGWLRKLLPCLSVLSVFRNLNRVGYPVLVPNGRCQNFFFRMGLLEKTGATLAIQLETCAVGERIAACLQRPLHEVYLWIAAFVGELAGMAPRTALCTGTPRCETCALTVYCHYYRYRRPRAADSTTPLPIKEWRPGDRPRERLMQHGAHKLEDSELLAIVLRTGAGKTNVLELARRLLERFGGLQGIEEASLEELQSIHGIGKMKAIDLKAVFELGRRQTYCPLQPGDVIDSSETVYESYRGRFLRVKQEEFILLMLDTKHQVIREEVISRGGLDVSIVHPREVFKAAIRASAAAVIFVHNHPSGDPTPSHDDHVITARLEEAAQLLKIEVLDHIVVGEDRYYSFTDGRVLTPGEALEDDKEEH